MARIDDVWHSTCWYLMTFKPQTKEPAETDRKSLIMSFPSPFIIRLCADTRAEKIEKKDQKSDWRCAPTQFVEGEDALISSTSHHHNKQQLQE